MDKPSLGPLCLDFEYRLAFGRFLPLSFLGLGGDVEEAVEAEAVGGVPTLDASLSLLALPGEYSGSC